MMDTAEFRGGCAEHAGLEFSSWGLSTLLKGTTDADGARHQSFPLPARRSEPLQSVQLATIQFRAQAERTATLLHAGIDPTGCRPAAGIPKHTFDCVGAEKSYLLHVRFDQTET